MANKVYIQALTGVQSLVSARAASRALDNALKAKGETPETVDAEVMSRILLGPVLSEFEMILPPEGLKRQLRSLAAGLRKNFPKPEPSEPSRDAELTSDSGSTPEKGLENAHEERADEVDEKADVNAPEQETDPGFVYQTNALNEVPASLDLISPGATTSVISEVIPERLPETASSDLPSDSFEIPQEMLEHVPEAVEVASKPASPESEPLSQEMLEAAVLRLAQLEQVKFVAALRSDGEIASQRGSGIDVNALAQLGLVGLKLLRRSGPLRTFYLAHTQGQLFLLPFGNDTLTLVGTPELNVGAVFNTLNALKEER